VLQVLVSDPTNLLIQEIPVRTPYKRMEVYWAPVKLIEAIIEKVAPQQNEFLMMLEEAGQVLSNIEETEETVINEQELDEEINKSLLVNLFEGALIEAVRRDASDIHIIPSGKTSTDFYFRIDGKLQLWFRQENTAP